MNASLDPSVVPFALVVDEKNYHRVALGTLVESLGFKVSTTTTNPEALQLAREIRFTLIVLGFPDATSDTPETARRIRALPGYTSRVGVLATTSQATPEKRMQCLMSGIDDLLALPVNREQLQQALEAIAARSSALASSSPEQTPADPLKNLRLVAERKRVPFTAEVNLYVTEFAAELRQLSDALNRHDTAAAARAVHALQGRCAFIHEDPLKTRLQNIGNLVTASRWTMADLCLRDCENDFADLRLRLVANAQDGPPGSGR